MRAFAIGRAAGVGALAGLFLAAPAYAAFHDRVANPYLHNLLDILTLIAVTSPLWTAYLWGAHRKRGLTALIAVVQLPVAAFAFVPIADPVLHVTAIALSLTITGTALWYVRRAAKEPAVAGDEVTAK